MRIWCLGFKVQGFRVQGLGFGGLVCKGGGMKRRGNRGALWETLTASAGAEENFVRRISQP